jgi:IclR family KDG regulon transcriptional repressor
MSDKNEQGTSNQSLARALSILDLFSGKEYSWGIRDIARELKSNPATIYRSVKTMQAAGFLEKDTSTNRYLLGPKFLMMAENYTRHNPVQVVAQNIFEKYSQKFPHNFYLGKLFNEKIMYIAILEGKGPIKVSVSLGVSIDLYCSALGKALLAFQDDQYIEDYLNKTVLQSFTENTITDPQKIREEIKSIRKLGYAINHAERYEGIGAISMPLIRNNREADMAVCLTYPQHMIFDKSLILEDLIKMLADITNEISIRLIVS